MGGGLSEDVYSGRMRHLNGFRRYNGNDFLGEASAVSELPPIPFKQPCKHLQARTLGGAKGAE